MKNATVFSACQTSIRKEYFWAVIKHCMVAQKDLSAKDAAEIMFPAACSEVVFMIDMKKIDKLIDFMDQKDWAAAHALLDVDELADPGESTVAHWRSVVLHDEGRNEEALQYLADNLYRFNCKTNAFRKRAELLHEMGQHAAALVEIEKAPFDAEIEDYWALVMEGKFFRLYLMTRAGLPISPEQWAEIPDEYISLKPTGEQISKEQLMKQVKRR